MTLRAVVLAVDDNSLVDDTGRYDVSPYDVMKPPASTLLPVYALTRTPGL